jgi:hypothetical protein
MKLRSRPAPPPTAHQPASLVTAIDDGRGGSLVWLTDAKANLWFSSTDAAARSTPI